MTAPTLDLTSQLAQYRAEWSAYEKRLDARVELLRTFKQGMELLLLVCAYLFFYLIDCLAQMISAW